VVVVVVDGVLFDVVVVVRVREWSSVEHEVKKEEEGLG